MTRLVLFDVDGTLIDSQDHIVAAFTEMYRVAGRPPRPRDTMLSVVGLSLPLAISRLEPDLSPTAAETWADAYRGAFVSTRLTGAPSPLFPGARSALVRLRQVGAALGVATGKSRRGLKHVFAAHDLASFFDTCQTADEHPSKPDPSMVLAALADTRASAVGAVLVGDTSFDIEMGRAAGIATVGVTWGYHSRSQLLAAGADRLIDSFDALDEALSELPGVPA